MLSAAVLLLTFGSLDCVIFADSFRKMGGEATIEAESDLIRVRWLPAAPNDTKELVDLAVALLKQGAFKQAKPILESLSNRFPEDVAVHFNYGMMLSDQGLFDEAIRHLLTAVKLSPGHAHAWNALGVAYLRIGKEEEAIRALERSHGLQPDNPYTLRNLGGLLAKDDPLKGLPYLEKAAKLLPKDQQALYGYGLCLAKVNRTNHADEVFRRTVVISPYTQVAELCRKERSLIAAQNLRSSWSVEDGCSYVLPFRHGDF